MEHLTDYLNDHLAGAVGALELLDRLVETFQMLGQASHGRFGNLRKFRVRLCQRQQFIDASDALGNDNAEFGKMAAKRVTLMVRCLTNISRVLCSISTAC